MYKDIYMCVCVCVCVCVCAKSLQFCPTLCDLMDCNLPGSSVHGILQVRILIWVAMPSSRGSSRLRDWTHSLMSPALTDGFCTTEPPEEPIWIIVHSYMKWSESHSVVSDSLQLHGLYSPWTSLGQNTIVGSYSLLQGIFPTQGSNPGLLHYRRIFYKLSHQGRSCL